MYCSIASSTKMTVMSFCGGKVLTEWWTGILGSHVIEALQEPTAPDTTVGVLVHGLYVCEDLQAITTSERFERCGRIKVLKMVLPSLWPPYGPSELTSIEVLSNVFATL